MEVLADMFFRIQDDQRITYRYTYTLADVFGELGGLRELFMGIIILLLRPFYRYYQTISAGEALKDIDTNSKKLKGKRATGSDPERNMSQSLMSKSISKRDRLRAYVNYMLGMSVFKVSKDGPDNIENIKKEFIQLEDKFDVYNILAN